MNTFTLHGVAVKVIAITGYKARKIQVGRMSENEKAKFESFIRSVTPCNGHMMELVEGGKTVPGRFSPLNTYETIVRMAAPLLPSSSVDYCDLEFTYVAERDIVQAEVCQPAFQGEPFGANWFAAQPENDKEESIVSDIVTLRDVCAFVVSANSNGDADVIIGAISSEEYEGLLGLARRIRHGCHLQEIETHDTTLHCIRIHVRAPGCFPSKYIRVQLGVITMRLYGSKNGAVLESIRIAERVPTRWKWFGNHTDLFAELGEYVDTDILLTENLGTAHIRPIWTDAGLHETIPAIEKIVFNEPATIIFWKDGTKSIVKARDGEPYDAEKGIAMAIAKKALGNQRDYYNTFIHWLRRYKKKLNAAPREKYVTPQLEILEDRVTEKPKKSSAKKKTASKKGGKK